MRLVHNQAIATEYVDAAMMRALDPNERPWKPGSKLSFEQHVCSVLWSAYGNLLQKEQALLEKPPGDIRDVPVGDARNPVRVLLDNKREQLANTRYEALFVRAKDDALVLLLLDETKDGRSTSRALAKGYTLGEVEAARKRLKRYIEAVVKDHPGPYEKGG
jgi:hypothetical protein